MPELSPQIMTIIIAAIVALIAGFVSAYFATRGAEARLKEEYQDEVSVERMARQVLIINKSKTLPFSTLTSLLGGLRADELRKALIGAGAVRFANDEGAEEWGLITRNRGRIAKGTGLYAGPSVSAEILDYEREQDPYHPMPEDEGSKTETSGETNDEMTEAAQALEGVAAYIAKAAKAPSSTTELDEIDSADVDTVENRLVDRALGLQKKGTKFMPLKSKNKGKGKKPDRLIGALDDET